MPKVVRLRLAQSPAAVPLVSARRHGRAPRAGPPPHELGAELSAERPDRQGRWLGVVGRARVRWLGARHAAPVVPGLAPAVDASAVMVPNKYKATSIDTDHPASSAEGWDYIRRH